MSLQQQDGAVARCDRRKQQNSNGEKRESIKKWAKKQVCAITDDFK